MNCYTQEKTLININLKKNKILKHFCSKNQTEYMLCNILIDKNNMNKYITKKKIKLFINMVKSNKYFINSNGRCTEEFKKIYEYIEGIIIYKLTTSAKYTLQNFLASVGAKSNHLFQLPKQTVPFWHLFLNTHFYKSVMETNKINENELYDVIIVGAGLTGTSILYHTYLQQADESKKIALIEESFPGAYSSGRNGGNFQLFPEFPVHISNILKDKNITHDFFNLTKNNSARMKKIINDLKIDCDYSEIGWLRMSHDKTEETLLIDEIEILQKIYGKDIVEIVDKDHIKTKYGFETNYFGRMVKNSGNYNPVKFIDKILEHCLKKNNISLFNNTKLIKFEEINNIIKLTVTNYGVEKEIKTKKLIFATNVFTRELIPELNDKIKCIGSQIINLEHVNNNLNGITCTEQMGKIYFNIPKITQYNDDQSGSTYGMLHFGYDFDINDNYKGDPRNIPISENLYDEMKKIIDKKFPETINQPPSRIWTGPLAFTNDNIPIISFYKNKNIIIAAGFQGFGGSFCVETGYVVSKMIETEEYQNEAPENIFGINRLI